MKQKAVSCTVIVDQNLFLKNYERKTNEPKHNYVHSHPTDFEKKVLGWRFGPATRQG